VAAAAFLAGVLWAAGNCLLIVAVARAGIARSYVVINFSAVLSFAGGVAFLGELTDLAASRWLRLAAAMALVLAGSYLVVTTSGRRGAGARDGAMSSTVRGGLLAAFASTVFFAAYNTITAYVLNNAGTPAGATFAAVAPGIACGALAVALLAPGRPLRAWRRAPARSHGLALAQGLVWATAMVFILFGWKGVGIAVGTSIQVGVQTLVGALWGIPVLGELAGRPNPRAAALRFAGGALLTVAGIWILAGAFGG
jgi:glucose uptake protein GlcU